MSCLSELKLIKSNIKANCEQPKLIYANRSQLFRLTGVLCRLTKTQKFIFQPST